MIAAVASKHGFAPHVIAVPLFISSRAGASFFKAARRLKGIATVPNTSPDEGAAACFGALGLIDAVVSAVQAAGFCCSGCVRAAVSIVLKARESNAQQVHDAADGAGLSKCLSGIRN